MKYQAFFYFNISQDILMRTDSNLCRKELTVHWSAPNSLSMSNLQPCTNSVWGDENEAVAPIIWLYQIVDAQKEEVCFPELLKTLRSYTTSIQLLKIMSSVYGTVLLWFRYSISIIIPRNANMRSFRHAHIITQNISDDLL